MLSIATPHLTLPPTTDLHSLNRKQHPSLHLPSWHPRRLCRVLRSIIHKAKTRPARRYPALHPPHRTHVPRNRALREDFWDLDSASIGREIICCVSYSRAGGVRVGAVDVWDCVCAFCVRVVILWDGEIWKRVGGAIFYGDGDGVVDAFHVE